MSSRTFLRFLGAGMMRAPRHILPFAVRVEEVIGVVIFALVLLAAVAAPAFASLAKAAPEWAVYARWVAVMVLALAFLRGLYDLYAEERDQRAKEGADSREASSRRGATFRRAESLEREVRRLRGDRDGYKRNWEVNHPDILERLSEERKGLEGQLAAERRGKEAASDQAQEWKARYEKVCEDLKSRLQQVKHRLRYCAAQIDRMVEVRMVLWAEWQQVVNYTRDSVRVSLGAHAETEVVALAVTDAEQLPITENLDHGRTDTKVYATFKGEYLPDWLRGQADQIDDSDLVPGFAGFK